MHDPDNQKTIQKLVESFGTDDCLRLGFLDQDDNATLRLTRGGFGYLLDVEAVEVDSLAEAYAAGYQRGFGHAVGDD